MSPATTYRLPRAGFGTRTNASPDNQPIETNIIRSIPMSTLPNTSANSGGWITFTYTQFAVAIGMTALGIFFMPVELMVKGYMLMSSVFLIGATFTLAKTVRDEHEAKKLVSRIDDARTEKLLMEVGR